MLHVHYTLKIFKNRIKIVRTTDAFNCIIIIPDRYFLNKFKIVFIKIELKLCQNAQKKEKSF